MTITYHDCAHVQPDTASLCSLHGYLESPPPARGRDCAELTLSPGSLKVFRVMVDKTGDRSMVGWTNKNKETVPRPSARPATTPHATAAVTA
jgi:hypothetical protein